MREGSINGSLALLPDGELVELAQQGQRSAFENLFQRHRNRIYTVALGIVGNPTDAKDVVQETYLKAYLKLPRLNKDGAVAAYLCRTASNAAIDVIRSRRTSTSMTADDDGYLLPLPSTDPEPGAILEKQLTHRALMDAVLELPDEHRLVIVLHHLEGQPVDQIAKRLRIPVGTVKSRLGRAREVLRRRMIAKGES